MARNADLMEVELREGELWGVKEWRIFSDDDASVKRNEMAGAEDVREFRRIRHAPDRAARYSDIVSATESPSILLLLAGERVLQREPLRKTELGLFREAAEKFAARRDAPPYVRTHAVRTLGHRCEMRSLRILLEVFGEVASTPDADRTLAYETLNGISSHLNYPAAVLRPAGQEPDDRPVAVPEQLREPLRRLTTDLDLYEKRCVAEGRPSDDLTLREIRAVRNLLQSPPWVPPLEPAP